MVALILRLRFATLLGAFRVRPARMLLRVLSVVALFAASIALALRIEADGSFLFAASVITSSLIVFAAVLLPSILGPEDPFDPRRFRALGLEPGQVALGIALSSLVSVPSLIILIGAVGFAAAVIDAGASASTAVIAAFGHTLVCVFAARLALAARALTGAGSGGRPEAVAVLGGGALLLAVIATIVSVPSWDEATGAALTTAADVLAYTPFGAWAALPLAPAEASVWAIWLIAGATLVILIGAWWALAVRLLTTTEHPLVARETVGLGWFAAMPRSAGGAVAARSLLYGFTDSRHVANTIVIPIAAVAAAVPLIVAGVPFEIAALLPVPLIALLYGWLPHNDLAYDSSALWLHIAAGVRGSADRIGRLAPVLAVAIPALAAAIVVTVLLADAEAVVFAIVGCAFALLFAGLGLSSVASVVWPYPVSRPGDTPFRQPQRTGSSGAWSQVFVMLATIALAAPTLWFGWLTVTTDPSLQIMTFWMGVGTGAVVFIVGVVTGSAVFNRRGSRLMEFAGAT